MFWLFFNAKQNNEKSNFYVKGEAKYREKSILKRNSDKMGGSKKVEAK
jgi:hypothetical protein